MIEPINPRPSIVGNFNLKPKIIRLMPTQAQILIVDDHPTNIRVLSDVLIDYGFAVLVAKDGENALQKLQRVTPDLILLDVLMPGIDGFETCQRIKAQENTQDIPVIFMTALTDAVDKIKGLTIGAVDYITKPLQHEEVIARVNVHLQLRQLTKQLATQNALLQDEMRSRALAQSAQRQSEEKFAKIFRHNPVAMVMLNRESGRFVEVNQSWVDLMGYAPEEILGKTIAELGCGIAPVHLDRIQFLCQAIEQWDQVELPLVTRTGAQRWLLTSAEIVDLAQMSCVLVTAQDITHRKQTEANLRQSEAKLRQAEQLAHMGNWELDLASQTGIWSEETFRIFGFDPSQPEPTFAEFLAMVHEADRANVQTLVDRAINQGLPFHVDYQFTRRDGSLRYLHTQAEPLRDGQGQVVKLFGIVLDMTERKQAEVALQVSEARLQLVLEANDDGIWDWDIATNRTFRSVQWYQILGYSPEELTDNNEEWSNRIHPEDQARVRAAEQAYLTHQAPIYVIEYRLRCKDGSYRWLESRGIAQWDDQDQPIRMIGSSRDITAAKQQAVELQQARDAAEAANRAKSSFLANINHELRTPLTIILGCSELLSTESSLTPKQKQRLASIDRSVHHLLDLINKVLELSKIEAGAATLEISTVDLWSLLHSLEEMFLPQTTAKGLQLQVARSADLPQFIQTDERKLSQILINLLANAVKFTTTGGVRLAARIAVAVEPDPGAAIATTTQEQSGSLSPATFTLGSPLPSPVRPLSPLAVTLDFAVEDTGAGINEAELTSIFEAFVQTELGRQSHQGTGLGLSICQQFIHLLQGQITVQSQIGRGTRFGLTLPVQLAASPQLSPTPPVAARPSQYAYRVLVVEDTEDAREILVHILMANGFDVQAAENGQAAIAVWQTWQPHIILMDMRMPIMDGYAATRAIRAQEQQVLADAQLDGDRPHPVVIIAVTANAFDEDRQPILAAGCDAIVCKPFREADLLATMTKRLGISPITALPQPPVAVAPDARPATTMAQPLTTLSSQLALMPIAWQLELEHTTQRLNAERCWQLIQQIPTEQTHLLQVLIELLDNFRFDLIADLITLSQASRGTMSLTEHPTSDFKR
jgi:PAS domain S-box-containing protein